MALQQTNSSVKRTEENLLTISFDHVNDVAGRLSLVFTHDLAETPFHIRPWHPSLGPYVADIFSRLCFYADCVKCVIITVLQRGSEKGGSGCGSFA